MIKYYKLLDILKRRGISRKEFGEMIEVHSNTLHSLFNNKFVNLSTIDRICKALGVQPGDILEYENDGTENPAAD